MKTYGGSQFDENDFLLFATKIKYLTYNTYLEIAYNDETPGYKERTKKKLADYKVYIKEELLDSYGKKSKFNELNDMVVKVAKDDNYVEVADAGFDETYDFTGLTEKILKKIGISYVLTPEELDSIRNKLESSSSQGATDTQDIPLRNSSRTSSSSSRGRTKKKKPTLKKKKKKKKPTLKKKKPTLKKKKPTLKKKMGGMGENLTINLGARAAHILGDKIVEKIMKWITDNNKQTFNDVINETLGNLIEKGVIPKNIDIKQILREILNDLRITTSYLPDSETSDSRETENVAAEKAEQERIAAEQERIAAEKAEQAAAEEKAEQERIAAEKAEQERIAAEKAEKERIAAEKAKKERIAAEKANLAHSIGAE